MNKHELVVSAVKISNLKLSQKDSACFFVAVVASIGKAIKRDKRLVISGLGTFKVAKRKARKGRNPATGETIRIKASKTIRFKPTPTMKKGL